MGLSSVALMATTQTQTKPDKNNHILVPWQKELVKNAVELICLIEVENN